MTLSTAIVYTSVYQAVFTEISVIKNIGVLFQFNFIFVLGDHTQGRSDPLDIEHVTITHTHIYVQNIHAYSILSKIINTIN